MRVRGRKTRRVNSNHAVAGPLSRSSLSRSESMGSRRAALRSRGKKRTTHSIRKLLLPISGPICAVLMLRLCHTCHNITKTEKHFRLSKQLQHHATLPQSVPQIYSTCILHKEEYADSAALIDKCLVARIIQHKHKGGTGDVSYVCSAPRITTRLYRRSRQPYRSNGPSRPRFDDVLVQFAQLSRQAQPPLDMFPVNAITQRKSFTATFAPAT